MVWHMKVRTERGVLPEEDLRRTSRVLQRAIEAIEADEGSKAEHFLGEFVENETDLLCQVVIHS
jgi:hypothetical protein